MTESSLIVLLTAAGGGFEIGLIVKEIAADRRLTRRLFPQIVELSGTASMSGGGSLRANLTVDRETEPTIEERVTNLETALDGLRHSVEETARATRTETREAIGEATAKITARGEERDQALRHFLHDQLTGDIAWRISGVMLVLIGIVCTIAASIWATLASRASMGSHIIPP